MSKEVVVQDPTVFVVGAEKFDYLKKSIMKKILLVSLVYSFS